MHNELVWRLKAGSRFIETCEAVFTYNMASRLPLIEAPTLVMAGETDTLVEYVERTARLVKRSRQHIVPGATNFMMLQEPEKLAEIIRDFLANPGVWKNLERARLTAEERPPPLERTDRASPYGLFLAFQGRL